MKHRTLNAVGDWTWGKGKQSYTKDEAGILLNIQTRLRSWKYDSFKNPQEGVDYNNYLDIGTKSFLDADVKRVILQSEGVLKITSYTSSIDRTTRAFTGEVEVLTIYGSLELEI